MPYNILKNQVEFNAQRILEGIVTYMRKVLGNQIQEAIMKLVPPTAQFVSEQVAKEVVKLAGQEYIHQEIYLKNGWVLAAYGNGTKLVKYPPSQYHVFDVVRFEGVDKEKVLAAVDKYWNLPYDYTSLGLNTIAEIFGAFGKFAGFEDLEDKVQGFLRYDNPNAMICSELVQRMLQEGGVKFDQPLEYISPSDLKDHLQARLL